DRVHGKVEFAPLLADPLEHRLHLAGFPRIEWHEDRRFELPSERLDVFLCLVIEICDPELGAQRPECLGAAPRDRIFVGNADDETFFSLEQLGFYDRDHSTRPLYSGGRVFTASSRCLARLCVRSCAWARCQAIARG